MHTLRNKHPSLNDVVQLIDDLLKELTVAPPFPVKGINCLLPCDSSLDIKHVFSPLLLKLKDELMKSEPNSFAIGQLVSEKFEP